MNAKSGGDVDRARELAVFVAVVDHASFSAAGRLLGLSPSAVSRTIDRTEARLGVRLMIRSTRSLSLTLEGQAYLQAARRILKDLDDTEQHLADQGSPRGRLRVSAALSHGRLFVVPLMPEFASLYPDILVDLSLSDTVADIPGGHADVAVRFGKLPDSNLTALKLGEARRIVVASPEYLARHGTPAHPRELADHCCLNFNFARTETSWPFLVDGTVQWMPIRGGIEANSGEILGCLASIGMGIVRVGDFLVEAGIKEGKLVPILQEFNPGDTEEVHIVFVGGPNMPARVRVFVDFLAARIVHRPQ